MILIKQFWHRLNGRERLAVGSCLATLALAFAWFALIQRPLSVLRQAPALHAQADAQLASMRAMAATAQTLRQTAASASNAAVDPLKALEAALASHLGATASMTALGSSVNVTLKGANAYKLLAFVAAARNEAKALPVAVNLQQRQSDGAVLWDGTLTFSLGTSP